MASVSLVLTGDTDIQAALSTLQLNFELRDVIAKELLNTGVRNREEFRFLFEDEFNLTALLDVALGPASSKDSLAKAVVPPR